MSYQWREGNEVDLLINGEDYYPRVFECIRQARSEVLIETFIIFEDKVGQELQQVLIEAAQRGVRVELTVDGYGSADLSREFVIAMTAAGVNLHVFDPSPRWLGVRTNLFRRLHRKIVVVDGKRAFVGGINYSADHLGDFGPMAKQDYAVEVAGPVVADLHRASLRLMRPALDAPSDVQPDGRAAGAARMLLSIRDNNGHSRDIEAQYLLAIRAARQRLVIANAYFFPGYRLLREMRNAARRGVQVTLILQGQPDMPWARGFSRMLYNYLLRDGVEIYEYCQRPLHGKVALADDEWATVGSSNLDPLSLALNLEANLILRDARFNQRLFEHLQGLASEHCKRISLERAIRGYWWRAPLIFLCFHFTRLFPAIAGWFPAHSPHLTSLRPDAQEQAQTCFDQGKPS
ncbi:cardiolipin synthase ClsB [Pseudomonas sp. Gutcm_11s]|uniref:cardiolipin synthase ClsB n=1 Tax=Pseudomonas sp. Gutcm_11s TaxID=3026088 RepID=UPI00235E5CC1|nr:cardiolipin synthase ClsB [Pseudomonas sp. Gutcm_11s]MDD0843555.1 cardiolipin synthase ClsB [Pseudomonas sp. Gutcm_11s]